MCIASEEQRELICLKIEKNEIEKAKVKNEILIEDLGPVW